MIERFHGKYKKPITILYPGDYYACRDDRIIGTILGSCVAVCLFDSRSGISGMNHFMLPGDFRTPEVFSNTSGRYGMFAMELLLGEMVKLGCRRDGLKAKVFGGAHVLNTAKGNFSIPESNIKFVDSYLNLEGIELVNSDVGGYQGRKILFFTDRESVFVKKMPSTVDSKYIQAEKDYREQLKADQEKSQVTLF